jgi:hypothetical protein
MRPRQYHAFAAVLSRTRGDLTLEFFTKRDGLINL